MQNEIIAKIDDLLKMGDSTASASTLQVEVREIDCDIKEKKLELKELKSSISDEKYFDASSEIVDKNIEISLSKKIKTLGKSLKNIEEQLSSVIEEEERQFNNIEIIKNSISRSEEYIKILNTKVKSANSDDVAIFKSLLKEEESKLKNDKKTLDKYNKEYDKLQAKIEVLSYSKEELDKKINQETDRLEETKSNLLNKKSYINMDMKKEDQEKMEFLESSIKELEKKKTELLADPVMIAEEAKNYLIDDDKTSALEKLRELKDIISKLPYMNIDSISSADTLEIELENAESKRDEFASMINSKNYESVDATLINDRIAYNNEKIDILNNRIEKIKEEINDTDNIKLADLNNRIKYCENEVENLRDKIEEYEATLEASDLTTNKKASLKASYDKKVEEYNNVIDLLNMYKTDRENMILYTYDLENNIIVELINNIKSIEEENKVLEKSCISSNKAKDIIAIENDKKILKELSDAVKSLKKRQKFKNTPSEIFDEIEILLGADKPEIEDVDFELEEFTNEDLSLIEENVSNDKEIVEEINEEISTTVNDKTEDSLEIDDTFDINDLDLSVFESDSTDDELIEEKVENSDEKKAEEENIENFDDIIINLPVIDEDTLDIEIDSIPEEEPEKLKVIDIEDINEDEELNDEFLIGDYISGE